jgi:hypothetical protein
VNRLDEGSAHNSSSRTFCCRNTSAGACYTHTHTHTHTHKRSPSGGTYIHLTHCLRRDYTKRTSASPRTASSCYFAICVISRRSGGVCRTHLVSRSQFLCVPKKTKQQLVPLLPYQLDRDRGSLGRVFLETGSLKRHDYVTFLLRIARHKDTQGRVHIRKSRGNQRRVGEWRSSSTHQKG